MCRRTVHAPPVQRSFHDGFISSVDQRTKLAGANRLEVLLFSLGQDQLTGATGVGINVFDCAK